MTPAEQIQAEYAPLFAAAAERDAARREADELRRTSAFIEAPHEVCGIPLRAMTLPDYVALIEARNAHVSRVEEPEEPEALVRFWRPHNLAFLWLLSPDFRAGDRKALAAFTARYAHITYTDAMLGITEYLHETFADAPRAAKVDADGPPPPDPIGASFAAHWSHRLAKAYGWSRSEIRALPLKELFQHLRLIDADRLREAGRGLPPRLDGEVDALWDEMLKKIEYARQAAANA